MMQISAFFNGFISVDKPAFSAFHKQMIFLYRWDFTENIRRFEGGFAT